MLPLLGLVGGSAILGTAAALGSTATAAGGLTVAEAALLGAGSGLVLGGRRQEDEERGNQQHRSQPRIVGYRRLPDSSKVPIIQ